MKKIVGCFAAAMAIVMGGCGHADQVRPVVVEGRDDASAPAEHAIIAKIALTPDADGVHVTFPTQNGSTVQLLASDLVGKTVYWATTPGGEPIENAKPIDVAKTTLGADLTTTFASPAHYADGPWEVACVISVTGERPAGGPNPGDLAAFDNTPPPPGDPPVTGVSVRVHVQEADATLIASNRLFIRAGTR